MAGDLAPRWERWVTGTFDVYLESGQTMRFSGGVRSRYDAKNEHVKDIEFDGPFVLSPRLDDIVAVRKVLE